MKIAESETLLFTGDSITDCGRSRPVGRSGDGGRSLGDGYVSLVDGMLPERFPEYRINILNTGISGNRVPDLEARWKKDVLDHQPDWLSVLIGINDVWWLSDSSQDQKQIMLERYESGYRGLLDQTRSGLKGLVLMTPYLIQSDTSDPMRQEMDRHGSVVKRLAGEYDAVVADVQASFDRYLAGNSYDTICADRVHPNRAGHMIIATSFLEAIID